MTNQETIMLGIGGNIMAKFLGIEWNIGGEADTNVKLERYQQLRQAANDWPDLEPAHAEIERVGLFHELLTADVIQYDEPKQGFWGKLFG